MQMTIISTTGGNNYSLALKIQAIAKELEFNAEVINLEKYNFPLYSPTEEKKSVPTKATELSGIFGSSQILVFLAPEYNGSIPPVLSNAISWVTRSGKDWRQAFNGKLAIVGTYSGGGGLKVTQAMRSQLEHLGVIVHPRPILTNGGKEFNEKSANSILSDLKGLLK
jgi:chromate reductase, NAD(P)H dehydrogenase (quinone)